MGAGLLSGRRGCACGVVVVVLYSLSLGGPISCLREGGWIGFGLVWAWVWELDWRLLGWKGVGEMGSDIGGTSKLGLWVMGWFGDSMLSTSGYAV